MPIKVVIKKSDAKGKKYKAEFLEPPYTKVFRTVNFGSTGYQDYTTFPASIREDKKKSYLSRHEKRENWNDKFSAGALSRWILWNKPSLQASINDYKKRFKLI